MQKQDVLTAEDFDKVYYANRPNEKEFKRISAIVIKFGWDINARSNDLDKAFNYAISEVVKQAEINAVDTFKETGRGDLITGGYDSRTLEENEEFYRLALGSICCTSPFDTSFVVRNYFKAIGYKY